MTSIDRLLVANRGEIACRILRTCRRLGIATVAIFTADESQALWVEQAEAAVRVSSYLAAQEIVEAALGSGADAIHPGFGFLAENADFAEAVVAAGLIWVGPSAESMRRLSCKQSAKDLASSLGIPVLQGERYPLMIKALAGGGGKGMRRVYAPDELPAALQSARSEALRSFGDDRVLLEPLLEKARHLEVQILGDCQGKLVALGERDCSLQRRHQKIVEESPAPQLSPTLAASMQSDALRLAQAAHYCNAGTVEFLVQGDEHFFLEMNTRLQVEHPVTEEIFGVDLVEWQLRLAEGQALPDFAPPRGHAVEVRLYAEDPARGHLPSAGPVLLWEPPPEVRVESALRSGDVISPHFDPMVAKLISWGPDRPTALRRLRRALEQTYLFGVACNRDFLRDCLARLNQELLYVDSLDDWSWQPCPQPVLEKAVQRYLHGPGWPQSHDLWDGRFLTWEEDGFRHRHRLLASLDEVWVGGASGLARVDRRRGGATASTASSVQAPLTGSIVEVCVQPGQMVEAGQLLLRLEAMKMDHRLTSPLSGQVRAVHAQVGQVVQARALLVEMESP